MALRRKGSAPLSELDVLTDLISALQVEVKQLRQPGASSIQADRFDQTVDPPPWGMMLNWPGRHVEAAPTDTLVYYHPGYVDPNTGEVVTQGWKGIRPVRVKNIKVYSDRRLNRVNADGAFRFTIEEDLANTKIIWVRAFNGTVGTGATTIQIRNTTRGFDVLTVPITIDSGQISSKTAAVQPQIDTGGTLSDPRNKVHDDDFMFIDVDAVGTGSKGLGVYIAFQ